MRPIRRPTPQTLAAADLRDVAEATERSIASGLGTRPAGWWRIHAPDLADPRRHDGYAHLEGSKARAMERLAFLAESNELTPDELDSIEAGDGPRYEWRRAVVARTHRNGDTP